MIIRDNMMLKTSTRDGTSLPNITTGHAGDYRAKGEKELDGLFAGPWVDTMNFSS